MNKNARASAAAGSAPENDQFAVSLEGHGITVLDDVKVSELVRSPVLLTNARVVAMGKEMAELLRLAVPALDADDVVQLELRAWVRKGERRP